jgi:hypothetical protein
MHEISLEHERRASQLERGTNSKLAFLLLVVSVL